MTRSRTPALLALLLPLALLAGAWIAQLGFGLYPCEMCRWQRWPHYAAAFVASFAFGPRHARTLILVAFALIAVSGIIGVMHAGVEYGWWPGFTACTSTTRLTGATAAARLDELLAAPLVRCDRPAWTLGGISLAGFNAILSLGGALVILVMMRRAR